MFFTGLRANTPWDNLSGDIPKNADIEVDKLESFAVFVDAFLFPFEISTMRTVTTSPILFAFRSLKRNAWGLSSDQSEPFVLSFIPLSAEAAAESCALSSAAINPGDKLIISAVIISIYFISPHLLISISHLLCHYQSHFQLLL